MIPLIRKTLCVALLVLSFCSLAVAQKSTISLRVEGDTQIIVKSVPFKVIDASNASAKAKAAKDAGSNVSVLYDWRYPDSLSVTEGQGFITVTKAAKGTYTIKVKVILVDFDAKTITQETGETKVVVGSDPGPGPNPDPPTPDPDPDPKPDPAPIPDAGFRVLIIEDAKNRIKLPKEQSAILFDKRVRDYFQTKCVTEPDNKTKAWRIWDKDTDASADLKLWQDAMKRRRDSLPWIIISDGKKGYEGPLPKDVDSTITLLKKYAEGK